MKKLILLATIGLAAVLPSQAQSHKTLSFLNVASIQLTNTMQFTNLFSPVSSGSNVVGSIYTNNAGTRVIAAAADVQNVFKDVPLWAPEGGGWWPLLSPTNTTDSTVFPTPASIVVRTTAGSGANAAVTIAVAPVYSDDVATAGRPTEVTGTTVREVFSLTPTASTTQVWQFPVPLYRWPGAKYLRVIYGNNADTDASSQVVITDLALCGFVP